jgi:WD40 repeat protein
MIRTDRVFGRWLFRSGRHVCALKKIGVLAISIMAAVPAYGFGESPLKASGLRDSSTGQSRKAPAGGTSRPEQPKGASGKPVLVIQNGHTDTVRSIAFSPDGSTLVSGSVDKTVRIWDVPNGRLIRTIDAHSDNVNAVAYSPDGRLVASGSSDQSVKLWDPLTGGLVRKLDGADSEVLSLAFDPTGKLIAGGTADGDFDVWDARTGELKTSIEAKTPVTCVAFNVGGKVAATGSEDKSVRIWNAATGELVRTLQGHSNTVSSVAFSPDGKLIASGSWDRTVKLWDAGTGALVQTLQGHSGIVTSTAFDPKGKTIATGSADRSVKIWNVAGGSLIRSLEQNPSTVSTLAFNPAGNRLASGSLKNINLWAVESGRVVYRLEGHSSDIQSIAYSPDGTTLVAGSLTTLALWDVVTGKLVRVLEHGTDTSSVAYSPDGKLIASGGSQGVVKLWDPVSGKLIRPLSGHLSGVTSIAFSPDNKTLASGSVDNSIRIWDRTKGNSVRTIKSAHYSLIPALAYSPSGSVLASGSVDKTIKLWDPKNGRPIRTIQAHASEVRSIAFAPDGKTFASGSADKTAKLWDAASGDLIRSFEGHNYDVRAVAFSPDGAILATGSWDRTVGLWQAGTGQPLAKMQGHSAVVSSVAFSPQGTLASGSWDTTVNIWQVDTRRLLITLLAADDGDWLAYDPAGHYNGSDRASKYVTWRVGNTVYDFDQFFERFFQPEVIVHSLEAKKIEPPAQNLSTGFAPPPVVVITTPQPDQVITGDQLQVTVEARDAGGGVDEVRLFQNGKLVGADTRGIIVQRKKVYKYQVELIEGDNVFRAIAFNKDRSESRPFELTVKSTAPAKEATLHLLAVGINNYKNAGLNLNFAAPDAKAMVAFFKREGPRLFRDVDTVELYDGDATHEKIMAALQALNARSKPQDVLVIYVAGHGDNRESNWYFVPYDVTRPENDEELTGKGLASSELSGLLAKNHAQKIVLLLDACKSGSALIAFRGLEERKALLQLARSSGVHVIAASARDQNSAEVTELGHGIFTYLLLKGLAGEAVLRSSDKMVTVLGLSVYLNEQLPEISKKYKAEAQNPVSDSRGMDFPLTLVP